MQEPRSGNLSWTIFYLAYLENNALHVASAPGHDRVVELLPGKGADVNAQGGRYGTALQAASARGHDRVIELLLGKGADVNTQGGDYGTALQVASDGPSQSSRSAAGISILPRICQCLMLSKAITEKLRS